VTERLKIWIDAARNGYGLLRDWLGPMLRRR
jgi:hypothetical protein